jgi:rare lipoprotein A (peptidoglycan hydrolase)
MGGIFDLSLAAASELRMIGHGVIKCTIEKLETIRKKK